MNFSRNNNQTNWISGCSLDVNPLQDEMVLVTSKAAKQVILVSDYYKRYRLYGWQTIDRHSTCHSFAKHFPA